MSTREFATLITVLMGVIPGVTMLLPYLPGRFDASAATLSFLIRVASYASLPLTPIGLAWVIHGRQSRLWHRMALALAVLIAVVTVASSVAVNQLTIGIIIGVGAVSFIWRAHRRMQADLIHADGGRTALPVHLAMLPVLLVTFEVTVLPHAAEWSRDRVIEHSASLITEIEAFRERRGHYPLSLHALNRDVPTGVLGIERFLYEPNGEAYNLFFVRPHIELDAKEVVMFNPREEHRFTSHELDLLQYDGEQLDSRRGDRRRTSLRQSHWISILFD